MHYAAGQIITRVFHFMQTAYSTCCARKVRMQCSISPAVRENKIFVQLRGFFISCEHTYSACCARKVRIFYFMPRYAMRHLTPAGKIKSLYNYAFFISCELHTARAARVKSEYFILSAYAIRVRDMQCGILPQQGKLKKRVFFISMQLHTARALNLDIPMGERLFFDLSVGDKFLLFTLSYMFLLQFNLWPRPTFESSWLRSISVGQNCFYPSQLHESIPTWSWVRCIRSAYQNEILTPCLSGYLL